MLHWNPHLVMPALNSWTLAGRCVPPHDRWRAIVYFTEQMGERIDRAQDSDEDSETDS